METAKSTLDLLLAIDKTKIKRPAKRVEISRLTELAGSPVTFGCQALTLDEFEEIQEIASKGGEVDGNAIQMFTVLKGVTDPNFKDQSLQAGYGALTPRQLVEKLLLPGEITRLYNIISDLSGYGENAVVEVKNG